MHLRWLEVQGFKAFAERQRFEFGPGITVIVGPNGSGKSNIHDAIRWALGEQAGRQIRARKTQDVIFSGSDQRRQLGSAEVTLALDNSGGWMPVDFGEVTVTRRAHRSGENEYLINGQRVRLADVHDLFRRAQVGQNSYAMMSQGLVDEVLALRPLERRHLIEEAADVRRHRQQITLSERRLSETRDNLGHARLLMRELEPRLRQLERQSRKAGRYRELQAQLREALCVYYQQELRDANDALAAARARHDQRGQELAEARDDLQRHDARLDELATADAERREALEALQGKERELAEEALRLDQQIALAEQRLELLGQRRGDVEAERSASEAQPDQESADDSLPALELRVREARAALDREREALQSADERARSVLRDLSGAEARRARLDAELADAERRIVEDQQRRSQRQAERETAVARRAELIGGLRALGLRALELLRRDAAVEDATGEALRRREQAEGGLEQQLISLVEARDTARAATARVREQQERRRMLERLAEQPGPGAGAQALIAAAAGGEDVGEERDDDPLAGIVGVVSHLIRVPEGLEAAIEAALAEQLAAVVVEREQDAIAAIEYLREHGSGTATLLPLESVEHNYPLNLFNERGVIGVAARLVRTEQRYRPLIDTLLGRTIVVDDLDTARRTIGRGLGAVVTRDGVLLRPGGAYYGGRAGGAAQRFALQGEIEALPERIVEAQRVADATHTALQGAETQVTEARDAVDRARGGVREAEELARSHQQQIAELRRAQASEFSEMRLLRRVLADDADAGLGEAAAQRVEQAQRARAAVDGEIDALRDRSEAVVAERDAVAARATEATGALAAAEGLHGAATEQRTEREQARGRAVERLRQLEAQSRQLRQESEDLGLSLRDLRQRVANSRSALALVQAAVGPAHAELAETTEQERELAGSRGDGQARLLAAERASLQGDSDLRERAARLRALEQQLADEGLEVAGDGVVVAVAATSASTSESTSEAKSEPTSAPPADGGGPPSIAEPRAGDERSEPQPAPVRGGAEVDTATLRDRISELRGEIRALGAVNVEAVEDLSEERERHSFLGTQIEDLESAERELREAIKELRALIRSRFATAFEAVNTAFGEYFQRFFGGGSAELRLVQPAADTDGDHVDGEDPDGEDPGVEITARPPGKRIASLTVLSGGERALTSVALLFALLSVNPAPICVLDEVDAALDEANVGRFVDTLRELSERSQFIVITHSRRTIEAADAIYGVSMGEDSVSRVLSLRLADLSQAS